MTERTAVIFLQNAWSPLYAGKVWPRANFLGALERSRSGKMLKNLTGDLTQVWNTTPEVGRDSPSKLDVDLDHMLAVLKVNAPSVVVACGAQAIGAVPKVWDGPRLELPHPACRWLKADLYREGRRLLDLMVRGRMDFTARVWEQKGQKYQVEVMCDGHP